MDSESSIPGVPHAAWVAADQAFNHPSWSPDQPDELAQALCAAAPHIRIDELGCLIRELSARLVEIPLLGRGNNYRRAATDELIQFLFERCEELRP